MNELVRACSAERLKLRRTLAIRLAVAAPLFIVLLQLGVYLARGEDIEKATSDPARGFARGIVTLWTLVFLPFLATLVSALVASLDHQEHHWDQLFALPVRRSSIYAAKWIGVVGLVALSSVALPAFALGAVATLRLIRPEWAGLPLPTGLLLAGVARSGAAALLLISIQFWLSVRWRSFVLSLSRSESRASCLESSLSMRRCDSSASIRGQRPPLLPRRHSRSRR